MPTLGVALRWGGAGPYGWGVLLRARTCERSLLRVLEILCDPLVVPVLSELPTLALCLLFARKEARPRRAAVGSPRS